MSMPVLTVRDLRRRWKPAKERLQAARVDDPIVIRIHRCCSWLARVEEMGPAAATDDMALIMRWIALNSLYGRWNPDQREPNPDRQMLLQFADTLVAKDQQRHLEGVLLEHKPLVLAILDDEYLSKHYWEDPTLERATKSKRGVHEARNAYREGRFAGVLWRLLDRIYLLRCQLVHGAATAGGKLNRTALRRCNLMLEHLVPAMTLVVIDLADQNDWGELCYPPRSGYNQLPS